MEVPNFYEATIGYWETIGSPSKDIRDRYPKGTIEVPKRPASHWEWDGTKWVEGEKVEPVPASVEKIRLVRVLRARGVWGTVKAGMADDEELQEDWDILQRIPRSDPVAARIGEILAWDDAEIDRLFIDAAK